MPMSRKEFENIGKDFGYEPEDFKEITEEELEDLNEKDEISKYINENIMSALPPKDLFKKYCMDNEEIDLDYGNHKISIDCDITGWYLYVDYEQWYGQDFDEIYAILENLESELNKRLSEQQKAEKELEKSKEDIYNRINQLDNESTKEDIAKIEASIEFYSDYSKDVNGYRDRTTIGNFYELIKRNAPKAYEEFEALDWDEKCRLMEC